MQNNPNITLTLKRPNKHLTFLLPLKETSPILQRFSNDFLISALQKSNIKYFNKAGKSKGKAKRLDKIVIISSLVKAVSLKHNNKMKQKGDIYL